MVNEQTPLSLYDGITSFENNFVKATSSWRMRQFLAVFIFHIHSKFWIFFLVLFALFSYELIIWILFKYSISMDLMTFVYIFLFAICSIKHLAFFRGNKKIYFFMSQQIVFIFAIYACLLLPCVFLWIISILYTRLSILPLKKFIPLYGQLFKIILSVYKWF